MSRIPNLVFTYDLFQIFDSYVPPFILYGIDSQRSNSLNSPPPPTPPQFHPKGGHHSVVVGADLVGNWDTSTDKRVVGAEMNEAHNAGLIPQTRHDQDEIQYFGYSLIDVGKAIELAALMS